MRGVDYDATHLVKAVKGLDLNPNSYSWISIDGTNTRIAENNKDKAIEWHAAWAASHIEALGTGLKVLLPIPSSKTIVQSAEDYRTFKIAQAIAHRAAHCTVSSALRFIEARPSSREDGGSRDPEVLCPNMALKTPVPGGAIILIDDVKTSGGHAIAATWKLAEINRMPVLALACGRSMDTPLDDPFALQAEEIDVTRSS
jgi:hypothetical protein